MPSTYAHYRFGTELLTAMPGDVRRTIQRFRRLYEVGLHGPDIFFYHAPLVKTGNSFLGIKYHEQTGQEFFQRVCRTVRLERSEAALSYLYGVLTHYCLDAQLHPFVREHATVGLTALEIETEFDRFLLEKDGKTPPHAQDLSPHLKLTPGEWETVAKFYPPANANLVKDSLQKMTAFLKLLAAPEGAKRTVISKSITLFGKELSGAVMTSGPNPKCAHLNAELVDCYEAALAKFPEMLQQLQAHMTYNAALEQVFTDVF